MFLLVSSSVGRVLYSFRVHPDRPSRPRTSEKSIAPQERLRFVYYGAPFVSHETALSSASLTMPCGDWIRPATVRSVVSRTPESSGNNFANQVRVILDISANANMADTVQQLQRNGNKLDRHAAKQFLQQVSSFQASTVALVNALVQTARDLLRLLVLFYLSPILVPIYSLFLLIVFLIPDDNPDDDDEEEDYDSSDLVQEILSLVDMSGLLVTIALGCTLLLPVCYIVLFFVQLFWIEEALVQCRTEQLQCEFDKALHKTVPTLIRLSSHPKAKAIPAERVDLAEWVDLAVP